jgi:hypothetical protein
MLKNKIDLTKDGERHVHLHWHRSDGEGGYIPIAIDYADVVDAETRERIEAICARPITVRERGESTRAVSGSSKHFNALPRVLARLGYRVRQY